MTTAVGVVKPASPKLWAGRRWAKLAVWPGCSLSLSLARGLRQLRVVRFVDSRLLAKSGLASSLAGRRRAVPTGA
eukprot:1350458-Rhodomonas_salina.1